MGGSEVAELEPEQQNNTPKLPLLKPPPSFHSPEPSGLLTPPLHTSASVPFVWEEEPGKPRPCTAIVNFTPKRCLELPPRLLLLDPPSLRMSEDNCDGSSSGEGGKKLGTLVLSREVGLKEKGWFGNFSWREKALKVKREGSGRSHVFPAFADRDNDEHVGTVGGSHKKVKMTKVKRSGSFPNLLHGKPCVWTTICDGLKQVVPPWRSKKLRKDGYGSLRL